MTPAELAALSPGEKGRRLAEKLGWPVREILGTWHVNVSPTQGMHCKEIVTTWEGAGAVLEAMRGAGWAYSLETVDEVKRNASFWYTGDEFDADVDATRDTAPEAIADAALAALEETQ